MSVISVLPLLLAAEAFEQAAEAPPNSKTGVAVKEVVWTSTEENAVNAGTPPSENMSVEKGEPLEVILPAKTPVFLRLQQAVGSKISKAGDSFTYVLDRDVEVGGVTVLRAGTSGAGEVVHAKKGGGSGSGGELVLSAGSIELGGEQLALRSIRMTGGADDRIGLATAIGVVPIVGFLGFAVKGKEVEYQPGFVAEAMTAQPHAFLVASPGDPTRHAISDWDEGESP